MKFDQVTPRNHPVLSYKKNMNQEVTSSSNTGLVAQYYSYSQKYYRWFLGGSQHHGFHPSGRKISERKAQKNMLEKLAEELQLPPITSNLRILDAGSGQGITSIYLAEKYGCRVDGVTVTPSEVSTALKNAKKRGVAELTDFFLMDYSNTLFEDETFDRVFTLETLSHALDVQKALTEFYRILKPGGRIVLFEYTMADDKQFNASDFAILDMLTAASGSDGLKQIREENFQDLVGEVGFSDVTMKDISRNTLPTLTYLKKLLFLFYWYSSWRGNLKDHPNRLTAVEVSRMVRAGLIKYQIITALKK
ncbi:MAG: methyltransferase domain-containing protein [Candidatus Electrothrix sp. ATG2]|nr:methyltransferase domain-containing protein [Candidatus Electrothrix sp. ATG2]